MKKEMIKVLTLIIILIVILFIVFILNSNGKYKDTIKYDGKTYILLEYNMDIFTYNLNRNAYYEEDIIHPISHNKWDIVYFNGDLFILDKQVENATKYYKDDKNYEWYIVFDNDDYQVKESISISNKELNYLYNMDKAKKEKTITFDEIDRFADILKVSKDNLVQGITTLAQVDYNWYYKTEIMTDNDKEYVIEITNSLNKKINDLLEK